MNEFAGCRYRLIFPTFNAELWYVFENSATFLPTAALTLTSPCQSRYPLTNGFKCSFSYKTRRKYIDLARKLQFVLTH